jgi:predicted RNA-binding Zn ribbon-like protein
MSDSLPHHRWMRWSVQLAEAADGRPLCLSLANTRHWRNSAQPRDLLQGYGDVLDWAVAKAIYTSDEAAAMRARAEARATAADAELRRVIELREVIARVFSARAHARPVPPQDVARLMDNLDEASRRIKLRIVEDRLVPLVADDDEGLALPRWQAALSAIGLYTSEAVARVKQCADDRGCGWLFLDTTRNASRMFCFSNECGNRARQAKFRARPRPPPGAHAH